MLIGFEHPDSVKFVSYTGKFPNLCSGVLTLEIDGITYKFRDDTDFPTEFTYKRFWSTGGSCGWDSSYQGEWIIDARDIPKHLRKYAQEIERVFNHNVVFGCCGGCA